MRGVYFYSNSLANAGLLLFSQRLSVGVMETLILFPLVILVPTLRVGMHGQTLQRLETLEYSGYALGYSVEKSHESNLSITRRKQ